MRSVVEIHTGNTVKAPLSMIYSITQTEEKTFHEGWVC